MTNQALDRFLVYRDKRRVMQGCLTPEQCIAINLFWRQGVRAAVLAKVFQVSKNTIYYRCLTGDAESYPTSRDTNTARYTNQVIDEMGAHVAWKEFVTLEMIKAVNAELVANVKSRGPT